MIELLYYFLPVYVANSSPPFWVKLFPRWDWPLDAGLTFRGKRVFGRNKTLRGLFLGMVAAELVFLIQFFTWHPYELPWWFGFLLGFGALFVGDAFESFFKRQLDINPGGSWIPFDQTDYVIGVLLVTFGFVWPGWLGVLFLLVFSGLFSIVAHISGHFLGLLKDRV